MHENRGQTVEWAAHWPAENSDFQSRPISPTVKEIMQYDDAGAASWSDTERRGWFGFYFRWHPAANFYGRMKVALAKGHSPEICLQASGWKLESELEPALAEVRPGFKLPFRRYTFNAGGRTMYVFFAVVEDQVNGAVPGLFRMSSLDRIRAALAGSRNFGERSLEIAVSGFDSPDQAWSAFQSQLPQWIVETSRTEMRK
jgi:hypothetical protein